MTLLVMNQSQMSSMEEQMSGNYKSTRQAYYAAEKGMYVFLNALKTNYLANPNNNYWTNKSTAAQMGMPDNQGVSIPFGNDSVYWISAVNYDAANPAILVEVVSNGLEQGTSGVFTISAQLQLQSGIHPAFGYGILSNGNITLNGDATIQGNSHANGNLVVNGGGSSIIGNLSAAGTISGSGATDQNVTGDITPLDTPVTMPDINATLQSMETSATYNHAGDCDINVSGTVLKINNIAKAPLTAAGDGGGMIIYCSGNMTISGSSYTNFSFASAGNATVGGSSSLTASGQNTTAIVSLGSLVFNGSGSYHGVLWAGSQYTNNGNSTVYGAIVANGVANGDITQNGKSVVVSEATSNSNMSDGSGSDVIVASWK